MIGAVIFDVDGVLADTEPLHARARNQLLTELGLDVEAISPQAIGRGKRDFWSDVARGYGLRATADELTKREFSLIIDLAQKERLCAADGLKDALEALREKGVTAAVASSSDRDYVEKILEITCLHGYFGVLACGDEEVAAKPAPDVYRRAMEHCGVNAENAAAVEDSDTGARAAKAAGLFCVGFQGFSAAASCQKLALCDVTIERMSELVPVLFQIGR